MFFIPTSMLVLIIYQIAAGKSLFKENVNIARMKNRKYFYQQF